MKSQFNTEYLDELFLQVTKNFEKDYNLSMFGFNMSNMINSFLIHQAIEKGYNLHIRTYDKTENSTLYIPTIIATAIFGFYKNYISYNPIPKIGEILQRDRKRYSVIRVTQDIVSITNKAEGNLVRDISIKNYAKYIVSTATTETNGRKLNSGFEHYRNFFNQVFKENIGEYPPSKFQHKYLIITSKEILDSLREIKCKDLNVFKSLPISYITSSGQNTDSIPIDPMIYIVTDYETAKEYVIGKYDIETIVLIGNSKYRESYRAVNGDINAERIKNAIFIGSETVASFNNLKKWNWTVPEQDYMSKRQHHKATKAIVDNRAFGNALSGFCEVIAKIEQEYNISLIPEFISYLNLMSRLVIPDTKSRLNNQLEIIKQDFQKRAEDIINHAYFDKGIYDYKDDLSIITHAFDKIIQYVDNSKWEAFLAENDAKYIVVPKENVDFYNDILLSSKTKAISYGQLKDKTGVKDQPKVCFFSIYGYKHFKECYLSDNFKPIFILYNHEAEKFKEYQNRYSKEVIDELRSSDRQILTGVKYTQEAQYENIDDLISRFFNSDEQYKDNDIEDRESPIRGKCRFEFEDGSIEEIDSTKSVLLCNHGLKKVEKAERLCVGDIVRIYDNANKEQLWDIAVSNDRNGVFSDIMSSSKIWKDSLSKYTTEKKFTTEELFERLVNNGLRGIINHSTIDRWLQSNDGAKFPATDRNLYAIKTTINCPIMNDNYQFIRKNKKAYRGIMISLGRDLSNEIMTYIQSNGKVIGVNLNKYDENIRKGFISTNAREKVIKNITYYGADEEE